MPNVRKVNGGGLKGLQDKGKNYEQLTCVGRSKATN